MFQNFAESSDPGRSAERVAALRRVLAEAALDGFIVPRADEHQGESVPASAERLAWLSGFTGSAGTVVVLANRAAIFVDSRYTVQVRRQIDDAVFEVVSVPDTPISKWLKEHAETGMVIGCDPWLVTRSQVRRLQSTLEEVGAKLKLVNVNPVDAIWVDRPAPPRAPVSLQPKALAGASAAEKLAGLAETLAEKKADAVVLTDPASLAWTFNIRGGDVPHTPLPLSFAVLGREGRPELFIEAEKLSNAVRSALEDVAAVSEKSAFPDALAALGKAGAAVLFDADGSAEAVGAAIEAAGGKVIEGPDPVALPRARKSPAELAGARSAHVRDGAAFVRFLTWFQQTAPAGGLTEIAVARKLEAFRREAGEADGTPLEDISFDTIAGTGPNGAIVHYRVTETTDRAVFEGDLFLLDSGAQYRDGTTDITRTLLVGRPEPARLDTFRDRYTRVLKGHIAIAAARFPEGATGAQLDPLARVALWSGGFDYGHGTGHGVGAYLSVHEGPQRLSKTGHTPLEPGMILSNEPGYYVEDGFGIRIENLVVVRKAEVPPGGDLPMLSFETLTVVPIERRLIAPHLLTPPEIAWLDGYHARVHAALSGWRGFTHAEREWLAEACRPLVG